MSDVFVTTPAGRGPRPVAPEAPVSIGEVAAASFTLGRQDMAGAPEQALIDAYATVTQQLDRTVPDERNWWERNTRDRYFTAPYAAFPVNPDFVWRDVQRQRQRDPSFLKDLPARNDAEFRAWVKGQEGRRRGQAQDVTRRQRGLAQGAVGLATGIGTGLLDPVNVGAMIATGGTGAAGSIWRTMAREALVNGATEAAALPIVAANRAGFGEEMSAEEMLASVGIAAAGGAALPGAIRLAAKAAAPAAAAIGRAVDGAVPIDRQAAGALDRETLAQASDAEVAARFAAAVPAERRTAEQAAALAVIEREADLDGANPHGDTEAAIDTHAAATQAAMERILRAGDARPEPPAPAAIDLLDPPAAIAGDAPASDLRGWASKVIARESGGNPNARARTSSASGLGQFTDATWLGSYRRHFGGGRTDAEILALKTDPVLGRKMVELVGADYDRIFRAAGIAPTDGHRYLAHFLGPAKAVRVLRAGGETPIGAIVGARAVEANRSILDGRSAADVIAWADRKMGGDGAVPATARTAEAAPATIVDEPVADPLATMAERVSLKTFLDPVDGGEAMRSALIGPDGRIYVLKAEGGGNAHDLFGAAIGPERAAGFAAITTYRNEYALRRAAIATPAQERAIASLQARARRGGAEVTEGGVTGEIRPAYPLPPGMEAEATAAALAPAAPPEPAWRPDPDVGEAVRRYVQRTRGSLNPEAVAKATGTDAATARRTVEFLASTGDGNGLELSRSGRLRRAPRPEQPLGVLDFLARNGGLRNDEGHDLRNASIKLMTGWGPLLRRDGMSLDQARELVAEAGFFNRGTDAVSETDIADFLDLLQQGSRRKIVRGEDATEQLEIEGGAADDEWLAARIQRVDDELEEGGYGLTLTEDEKLEVALLGEHLGSVEDAVFETARGRLARSYEDEARLLDDADYETPEYDADGIEIRDARNAEAEGFGGEGGSRPEDPGRTQGGDRAPGGEPSEAGGAGARPRGGEGRPDLAVLGTFDDPAGPGPSAIVTSLTHDLEDAIAPTLDAGAAIDPAIAARNRQRAALAAASPLRARAEQDGTMGLGLFDATDQPGFRLAGDEDRGAADLLAEIDGDDAAIATARACMTPMGAAA